MSIIRDNCLNCLAKCDAWRVSSPLCLTSLLVAFHNEMLAQNGLARMLYLSRIRYGMFNSSFYLLFLVSCRVYDVEDCKAHELHSSISKCGTTWSVSILCWF